MMRRIVSKLVLCGETAVGKTSIRRSYFGDNFIRDHLSTLGADFAVKRVKINSNTTMELQIWDLAGQEGFQNLRQRFFKGASSAMMVFDITRMDTFNKLDNWFEQLWMGKETKSMPIAILGNKNDLEERAVTREDVMSYIEKLREKHGLQNEWIEYYETSALTGENIEECFQAVSHALMEKMD
jgi:small GTP-binding protein